VEVKSQGNASKEKRGRNEALTLARSVDRIVIARGKKMVTYDMTADQPDDETLLTHMLGPTGNLRAPALRKGRTLLVGFSDEAYRQTLK
jgi:hypothetical protein